MDLLWERITEWLKELLISGITDNLTGLFDATNRKVAEISAQVGTTPQAWNSSIDYSGAGKPQIRKNGNRESGGRKPWVRKNGNRHSGARKPVMRLCRQCAKRLMP